MFQFMFSCELGQNSRLQREMRALIVRCRGGRASYNTVILHGREGQALLERVTKQPKLVLMQKFFLVIEKKKMH